MKRLPLILIFLLFFLTACQGIFMPWASVTPAPPTASGVAPGTLTPAPQDTSSALWQTPTAVPTPSGPLTLRIWLPPQFDPAGDGTAAQILKQRLDEFSRRRPGLQLEVRVKAVDGPGGLLDSLTTASAAAPLALPDLIALPRDLLEPAALKGLLHPYDNLTTVMDESDWYSYAQELARLQQSIYGLPFAGDALTLVYRPAALPTPPSSWPQVVETAAPLIVPAGDPNAFFTLAMYQSASGAVRDDQGRPFLDTIVMTEVLTYYLQAEKAGAMPTWLTQYQNDDQAWQDFVNSAAITETKTFNRADQVATWASRYLNSPADDLALAMLPTIHGQPFTLADGWVWALPARDPMHQTRAIELAEYLTESQFLADWSRAAGLLPTRPSALKRWPNTPYRAIIDRVALSAKLLPSSDVLISLGAPLQQAVVQVINEQQGPLAAAQAAAASLAGP
jgi:multiple sugar transport system substrate-binding protein